MATANINDLRIHNARNYLEALHGPEGQYRGYMFLGRTTPWVVDNETQEEVPPTPTSSITDFYRTYQEMISMVHIDQNDKFYMIRRVPWQTGVVYDTYRPDYSPSRLSYNGARNVYDALFYVINSSNTVYVCLDNYRDSISTVEPAADSDDPFRTSDGYLWIKLYTISNNDMYEHSTDRYIPITTDDYSTATDGAVYCVKIEVPGSGYTNNPSGIVNQIPFYYCNILGDGTGAVARVEIENQEIVDISVVRNGTGYTYAVLDFTAFHVYQNESDLDMARNGLDPLGDGNLRTTVIINPTGGWGHRDDPLATEEENRHSAEFELARELGGTRIGVFSTLDYNTADFAQNTLFRQIGIIQDPKFNSSAGTNPDTVTACFSIKFDGDNRNSDINYAIGETITQIIERKPTGEPDKVAIGQVVGWNTEEQTDVLRYVQIPQLHADPTDGNLYKFQGEEDVVGMTSGKSERPYVEYNAPADEVVFVGGYADPEIVRYTGLITNVVNISPIQRQPTQSERISLIVAY